MKLRHLLPALMLALAPVTPSEAFVGISVNFAPPVLPVYVQPPCPVDGYLWTPGYYAYDEGYGDYYWVPGVWVAPPRVGYLWTPGYWGYYDGIYGYNAGYWGSSVGYYGGINYGFGYGGYGYGGGYWRGRQFLYNRAVTRVNTTVIHNTYVNNTVIRNRATNSRASFNGPRGVQTRPNAQQLAAARGPHVAPTGAQLNRRQALAQNHAAVSGVRGAASGRPNRPDLIARRQARRDRVAQGNVPVAHRANSPVRNPVSGRDPGAVRRQAVTRPYQPDRHGYYTPRRSAGDPRFGSVHRAPQSYPPMTAARHNGYNNPGRTAHFQPRPVNAPRTGGQGKRHDNRDHQHG